MSRLSDAVKAKYPQYANIPDEELDAKIIAKYPQYAPYGYVPRSVKQYGKNIVNSGINAAKGVAESAINIFNPNLQDNTVANLGRLVYDFGQYKPFEGEKGNVGNKFQQLLNFYKERYGGVENVLTTAYEDPIGMMLDASAVITGAGGALRTAGRAGNIAKLARAGEVAGAVGSGVDPLLGSARIARGALGKIPTKNAFRGLGKWLERAGEQTMTRGLGNPAEQAKFSQRYGQSFGDFMDEYKLYDRSPDAATQLKNDLLSQYDEIGLKGGKQVELANVIKAIDDKITEIQQGPAMYSDNAQAQIAELARRKQQLIEYAGMTGEGNIGVDKLIQYRRQAIDPDLPQSVFGLDSTATGKAMGAKAMRDVLRRTINSADPMLEKLGIDYGKAKVAEKIFNQSASRAQNRQLFNLGTAAKAITGSSVYGMPGALMGIAADVVMNNPKVLSGTSRILKSTGKSVVSGNLRAPSIPAVGVVGNGLYKTAKAGYMTTVPRGVPQYKSPSGQSNISEQQKKSGIQQQKLPDTQAQDSYTPSIPQQPTNTKPYVDPKYFYKAPEQPKFTNLPPFGKQVKLKKSSAY